MTPRARELARYLLLANGPLVIGDLAQSLQVSPRTIRYDLETIGDWLQERDIELLTKPRLGIWVQGEEENRNRCLQDLGSKNYSSTVFSSRERIYLALLLLLRSSSPLSLATMAQQIGVSRSTLAGDLKSAADMVRRWGMEIVGRPRVGLEIKGSERGRRELLAHVLVDLVAESELIRLLALSLQSDSRQGLADMASLSGGWLSEEATLNMLTVGKLVRKQLGPSLTDSSFVGLVVHLAIALERIAHGQRIDFDPDYLNQLAKTPEYQISQELADHLSESVGLEIPQTEIGYITLHLLGCRLRQRDTQSTTIDQDLSQRVIAFIASIEKELGLNLESDIELRNGLYLHLRQLLTRMQYGLMESNPLTEQIRGQYPSLFPVVLRSAQADLGLTQIDDDEAAFLTMHIGASLERQMNPKICRVLVACSTGEGSAGLLAARLKHEFPNVDVVAKGSTIDAVSRAEACNADLIVSTLPLANPSVPAVVVSPLLTADEIKHVQQAVSQMTSGDRTPSQPYQPTIWAAELTQLLTGVKTAEDMRTIIEEYLDTKLAPRPTPAKVSLPFDQRLDPSLVAFVQHLADGLDSPLPPDRVTGLTLHLTFALDRWRQGHFIREDETEHQRFDTSAPGVPELVWKSLVNLAQERGIPSPPVDEAIPVMRYLTIS